MSKLPDYVANAFFPVKLMCFNSCCCYTTVLIFVGVVTYVTFNIILFLCIFLNMVMLTFESSTLCIDDRLCFK